MGEIRFVGTGETRGYPYLMCKKIKICLLKTDACLIQVHFNVFACFGNRIHICLIRVAC